MNETSLSLISIAAVAVLSIGSPQSYNSKELAGRSAAAIAVETVDGKPAQISFDRRTALYVLAPRTGWCARNLANVQALWSARKADFRFIGLSLRRPGLEEDLKLLPIPFPVYVITNYRDPKLAAYGFGAAPALYVISSASVIERAWGGALTGPQQVDAEQFFGLKLPGVSPGLE